MKIIGVCESPRCDMPTGCHIAGIEEVADELEALEFLCREYPVTEVMDYTIPYEGCMTIWFMP